jgi:hypothetical protein
MRGGVSPGSSAVSEHLACCLLSAPGSRGFLMSGTNQKDSTSAQAQVKAVYEIIHTERAVYNPVTATLD